MQFASDTHGIPVSDCMRIKMRKINSCVMLLQV